VKWKVFAASAIGSQHRDAGAPCQDFAHWVVTEGVLVGIVCDGAGSAIEGHLGSEFLARTLAAQLSGSIATGGGQPRGDAPALRGQLLCAVERARALLGEMGVARGSTLRDLACTLVGCIVAADGGCFFHIGDGFAIGMAEDGGTVLSRPENGEYSDETYFVSEENWKEHFRVTPIGAVGRGALIGLMSDGAAPFVVDRARTGFYRPFIDPVKAFLAGAGEGDGCRALQALLGDERTHAITSDDKTLLLAIAD
jgi:hypothetical protein